MQKKCTQKIQKNEKKTQELAKITPKMPKMIYRG